MAESPATGTLAAIRARNYRRGGSCPPPRTVPMLWMRCLLVLLLALPAVALAQDSDDPAPTPPTAPSDPDVPEPEGPVEPLPPAPPSTSTEPLGPDLSGAPAELFARGYTRFAAGEFSAAIPLFQEVLRRDPEHRQARNYLVESLRASGRGAEADALREGPLAIAAPPPEPPAAKPEPAEVAPKDPEVKKKRMNPRAFRRGSAGIGIVGPSVGLGAWVELRPTWLVAINGGVGGLVIVKDGVGRGLGGFHVEATLAPIPFRLSPTIGVGLSGLFGDQVWRTDPWFAHLVQGNDFKLTPYFNLGVRYDAKRGVQLEVGVYLVPSLVPGLPLVPVPGGRLGFHFG